MKKMQEATSVKKHTFSNRILKYGVDSLFIGTSFFPSKPTQKHISIPVHSDQYDESMIDEAYNSHHHICSVPLKRPLQQLQLLHLQ